MHSLKVFDALPEYPRLRYSSFADMFLFVSVLNINFSISSIVLCLIVDLVLTATLFAFLTNAL